MTEQQFHLYYPNIFMNWSDAIKTFHTVTRHEPTSHFCVQYYHIHDAFSIFVVIILNTWHDLHDNLIFIDKKCRLHVYSNCTVRWNTLMCKEGAPSVPRHMSCLSQGCPSYILCGVELEQDVVSLVLLVLLGS
jgi:hypothetical protein